MEWIIIKLITNKKWISASKLVQTLEKKKEKYDVYFLIIIDNCNINYTKILGPGKRIINKK